MKKILFIAVLSLCVFGSQILFGSQSLAIETPAEENITAKTAIGEWQKEEAKILVVLKEKIAALKIKKEKDLANFILKRIKGEIGKGITNPIKREENYNNLTKALAIKDDTARLSSLKKLGIALGKTADEEDDSDDGDDNTDDDKKSGDDADKAKEAAMKEKQNNCLKNGGSWNYSAESCTKGTSGTGIVGGTAQGQGSSGSSNGGGGSSGGGSSGGGSSGGGGNSGGGSSGGGGGPSNGGGTMADSSGPGLVTEESKPSQCGPGGVTKLPAGTTPEQRAKMCRDTADGLLTSLNNACKPEDLEKKIEERNADKNGDGKSCRDLSKDAENTYKEAAGLSDDNGQRQKICEESKDKLKSESKSWDECKTIDKNCLAKARERFKNELKDSTTYNRFLALINAEVSTACYSDQAQLAFVESVMNRAISRIGTYSRYTSLKATIEDRNFFPETTTSKMNISIQGADRNKFGRLINQALNGSNACKYCTGNASESVGVGQKTLTVPAKAAACGSQQRYGIEQPDSEWLSKLKKMCGGSL